MDNKELLEIIKKQHYDILYLLLTIKAERNLIGSGGLVALWSMTNDGLEDLPGQKFSLDEVDNRFKEISDFLDKDEVPQ